MVRINEFGEIIRDEVPVSGRARQTTPPVAPPSPVPTQQNTDQPANVILGAIILGMIVFGLLGALAGYGAGKHWFPTETVEPARWSRSLGSFFHCLYIASWSSHPVHHAVQDATIPARILLAVVTAIGILAALFGDRKGAADNEGWGVLVGVAFVGLLGSAAASALVRVLVYALAHPVTWFLGDINSPMAGVIAVGLCWAAIGAVIGLIGGMILAALD